jgi:hypothetical protein
VAKRLTTAEMHRLARLGAAAKLGQLEREIEALKRAFPGLKSQPAPVPTTVAGDAARPEPAAPPPHLGRRPPMTAVERKAVSERMKRYWDARRKAQAK